MPAGLKKGQHGGTVRKREIKPLLSRENITRRNRETPNIEQRNASTLSSPSLLLQPPPCSNAPHLL